MKILESGFRFQRGFTLAELMQVVFIIMVLSVIGVTSYRSLMSNSKDQARMRDLTSIQQALELYHNENHFYPASSGVVFNAPLTNNSGRPTAVTPVTTFMSSVPNDPVAGATYAYVGQLNNSGGACDNNANNHCQHYVLCAKKVGSSSSNPPCPVAGLSCGSAGTCDIGVSAR